MYNKKMYLLSCILILLVLSFIINITNAVPEAPIEVGMNSSRRNMSPEISLPSIAGNVTFLSMNVSTSSSTWSAYYGNVNGTILLNTLDESSIYTWNIPNPTGEIYMVNESIDFANIECWNDTRTDDDTYYTLSEFENWLGVKPDALDGVNETFSSIGNGYHDEFYVGTNYIAANSCPSMSLHNSTGGVDPDKFQEVLLYEPIKELIIYTGLLEQNELGFNNEPIDFELIVGENGHDNDIGSTYYVYIELD